MCMGVFQAFGKPLKYFFLYLKEIPQMKTLQTKKQRDSW